MSDRTRHTLPDMPMKQPLAVLAVILTVVLGACAHGPGGMRLQPIGPSDSGKTVDLAVGRVMVVTLPANLGTGYRWEIVTEPDQRILIVVQAGYDRPVSEAPGASGQAWWRLRATGPGETSIALRYARPWAPGEDDKKFVLSVTVK